MSTSGVSATNFCKGIFLGNSLKSSPLRDSENEPLLSESEQARPRKKWGDMDGPLSWLVAMGIFMVNFVVLGQGRVAGILYINFMKDFHINRKMASAPYSIQQCTRMLFGPAAGMASSKFGIPIVIVVGCIIAALSSASCYFAEDIEWIIIMWGAIYGIGTAFTSSINVALIEQYFTKHRSSASGLAFSGSCIGSMLFPALMEILISKYGVQGSFLIMGGIILNAIPVAMLLRERSKSDCRNSAQSDLKRNSSSDHAESHGTVPKSSSGSNHEEHLRNPCIDESLSDSYIFHLPAQENRTSPYSFACSEKRTGSSASQFCNLQKYSRERLVETFPATSKRRKDPLLKRGSVMKNKERISSIKYQNGKYAENTNEVHLPAKKNLSQESSKLFLVHQHAENSVEQQNDLQDETSMASCESRLNPSYSSVDKSSTFEYNCGRKNESKDSVSEQLKENYNSCRSLMCKEKSTSEKYSTQCTFKNVINFKILHKNKDIVQNLLANKIPIGNEEAIPLSQEITQNDLESSDVEFISRELQRIEYYLQQPYDEVQRFLNDIREKLRKFKNLVDRDKNKFMMQNKLGLERRKLKYKEIRSITIKKSEYVVDVFEYRCEIPTELYIPLKLNELYERSSAYILSCYSGDKKISKILKQLKKLDEIISGNSNSCRSSSKMNSFESKTLSEVISCSDDMNFIERRASVPSSSVAIVLKLHTNPMFLLICLCRGLTALTFVPVFTSVVDFAVDKGLAVSDGVYAIATLSVGDLLGRLCTGWITDKEYIRDVNYMVTALILQGIFTAALPQTRGIAMVLPTLLVFAILQGSLFIKHSVLLMKYLQEHEKYIGLGFINLFSGILGLLTPYYIGYFRDYLGSYDIMYYINGGLSAFVGFLWIFEPYLIRFVPNLAEKEDNATSNESSITCTTSMNGKCRKKLFV